MGQYSDFTVMTYGSLGSQWTVQVFKEHKFLWWKWSGWEVLKFPLHYTIGSTYHDIDIKRRDETNEELVMEVELELDFLGYEYK